MTTTNEFIAKQTSGPQYTLIGSDPFDRALQNKDHFAMHIQQAIEDGLAKLKLPIILSSEKQRLKQSYC